MQCMVSGQTLIVQARVVCVVKFIDKPSNGMFIDWWLKVKWGKLMNYYIGPSDDPASNSLVCNLYSVCVLIPIESAFHIQFKIWPLVIHNVSNII